MTEPLTTIFVAGAVRDAGRGDPVNLRPGAVAVGAGRIVAVGEPDAVVRDVKHLGPHRRIDLPDRLILPAMVNAHAHLDLTDIGPVPYDPAGGFVGWVQMVMKLRPQAEEAITRAVRNGLRMSKAAGVGFVADIAGSDAAMAARLDAPGDAWLGGISYIECFGRAEDAARAAGERRNYWDRKFGKHARAGALWAELQPHAPYSAGPLVYSAATAALASQRVPSTHLAETPEEDEFIRSGTGPFAELLRRIGKWDENIRATELSPIEFLKDDLALSPWLLAHCNCVSDADLRILASEKLQGLTSIAYCPIASEYFGHGNHRYREMLDAGINVCLGTDSILCQPAAEPQPLGILPQMRRLYRRDRTDPNVLLGMATVRGLRGIRFAEEAATLRVTSEPGLIGRALHALGKPEGPRQQLTALRFDPTDPTDALTQVLLNDYPVEPLTV